MTGKMCILIGGAMISQGIVGEMMGKDAGCSGQSPPQPAKFVSQEEHNGQNHHIEQKQQIEHKQNIEHKQHIEQNEHIEQKQHIDHKQHIGQSKHIEQTTAATTAASAASTVAAAAPDTADLVRDVLKKLDEKIDGLGAQLNEHVENLQKNAVGMMGPENAGQVQGAMKQFSDTTENLDKQHSKMGNPLHWVMGALGLTIGFHGGNQKFQATALKSNPFSSILHSVYTLFFPERLDDLHNGKGNDNVMKAAEGAGGIEKVLNQVDVFMTAVDDKVDVALGTAKDAGVSDKTLRHLLGKYSLYLSLGLSHFHGWVREGLKPLVKLFSTLFSLSYMGYELGKIANLRWRSKQDHQDRKREEETAKIGESNTDTLNIAGGLLVGRQFLKQRVQHLIPSPSEILGVVSGVFVAFASKGRNVLKEVASFIPFGKKNSSGIESAFDSAAKFQEKLWSGFFLTNYALFLWEAIANHNKPNAPSYFSGYVVGEFLGKFVRKNDKMLKENFEMIKEKAHAALDGHKKDLEGLIPASKLAELKETIDKIRKNPETFVKESAVMKEIMEQVNDPETQKKIQNIVNEVEKEAGKLADAAIKQGEELLQNGQTKPSFLQTTVDKIAPSEESASGTRRMLRGAGQH